MYTEKGSALNFMMPNIPLADATAGVLEEVDIGAASANHGEMICVRSCVIDRLQFTLVGEAASGTSVAPRVVFTKRPTPLSATDESAIGTVVVASGGAIGATYYLDVAINLAVGDSVEIAHVIGTGTPTGKGFWSMLCSDKPESDGENAELIASA